MSVAAAALAATAGLCRADQIEAITRPSKDVTLSFVRPGQIAEILVKPGDVVKVGRMLVKLNDAVEKARLQQLKLQADDDTKIRAGQAQLAQKKVDLAEIQLAFKRKVATEMEVRHRELDVTIAKLSLELARFQKQQDRRRYQEAKLDLDRMALRSPITGRVEQVFFETGESARELTDVIRIVKIDPVWIDVPVPLAECLRLRRDQQATVQFNKQLCCKGRIIHIAEVADAASNTRTVRIEAPNPRSRPAGEHVMVGFPVARPKEPAATTQPDKPDSAKGKQE